MFSNLKSYLKAFFSDYQKERLEGDIISFRSELNVLALRSENEKLKNEIEKLLEKSLEAKAEKQYDKAWKYLNKAKSLKIYFYSNQGDLLSEAKIILKESSKVKQWRADAIKSLLMKDEQIKDGLNPELVFNAALLRDGEYDNSGFKYTIRKRQLWFAFYLILLVNIVFYILTFSNNCWNLMTPCELLIIHLFGIFGAVFSITVKLTSESKTIDIPEERMGSFITFLRPVIGASAAVIAYLLFQTGIVNLNEFSKSHLLNYIIAFISGFSERFVIEPLNKFGGKK